MSAPPPRARRTPLQRVVIGLCIVVALALIGVGGAIAFGKWKFDSIEKVDVNLAKGEIASGPINILIVGSDTRQEGDTSLEPGEPPGQRSDGIVVARLQPDGSRIDLLSIPRDLWVPIAGKGVEQRINSSYNEGPQVLIDTIKQNFEIEINHYIEVTFNGFLGLIDAVGGVNVYFPNRVQDRTLGFYIKEVGCHPLITNSALAFARTRHLEWSNERKWIPDPTGDLGRIARQQLLLRRAIQKLGKQGLDDVGTVNRLVGLGVKHVKLDSAFSLEDLAAIARRFARLTPEGMVDDTLPVVPHTTNAGAQVVLMDRAKADPVLAKYRTAPVTVAGAAPAPTVPSQVRVSVRNGSGIAGQAASVAEQLRKSGFSVGEPVDAGVKLRQTVLRYGPNGSALASLVASHLENTPSFELDDAMAPGEVLLLTATDLKSVWVEVPAGTPAPAVPSDDAARAAFANSPAKAPTTTVPAGASGATAAAAADTAQSSAPDAAYIPKQDDGICPP